jgi:hypothetical protein
MNTCALVICAMSMALVVRAAGATISGTVTDASDQPIQNARIDHIGKLVVVPPPDSAVKPSPDEPGTDAEGHFIITTNTPAFVIRKPGYDSQRLFVNGDAQVRVTMQRIKPSTGCRLTHPPVWKTKPANDIDYTATWIYFETKNGPKGIISGSGPMYSFGAPRDSDVWTSAEYAEVMYENGVIDARGHTADGKYWRSQTKFGAAAQYYNVDRATAEALDCWMDRKTN